MKWPLFLRVIALPFAIFFIILSWMMNAVGQDDRRKPTKEYEMELGDD